MTATVESILEQVRHLSPGERARVRDRLNEEASKYPSISPEVQDMLAGKTSRDFLIASKLSTEEIIAHLQAMNTDDVYIDEEGDATWDEVLDRVERNRLRLSNIPDVDTI